MPGPSVSRRMFAYDCPDELPVAVDALMAAPGATAVILNPRAANGRAGRQWRRFEPEIRSVLGDYTLFRTESRGHASVLAKTAVLEGYAHLVSVGGDGTHHEVLNGMMQARDEGAVLPRLSLLPKGTGADFSRTLGIPRGRRAIRHLASMHTRRIDIGRLRYTTQEGAEAMRYFFNMADFGLGGAVARRVNDKSKFFGGFLSFLYGVLMSLATWKAPQVQLDIDGQHIEGPMYNTFIANGRYCGGGMLVAPEARLDDGYFEVYVLGDFGRLEAVVNLPKLYQGRLMKRADKIRYVQARRITADSDALVLLNVDGEQPGRLPATIEIVPAALRITQSLGEH